MEDMQQVATAEQQKYVDRAAYYFERAYLCCRHELWPEAATNFGAALESLLRIRYGDKDTLARMIEKFDADPVFNDIRVFDGDGQTCVTCAVDGLRKLRNSVHPDCWIDASKGQVVEADLLVVMLYHVLVVCETRVAMFEPSPSTLLSQREAQRRPIAEPNPEPTSGTSTDS